MGFAEEEKERMKKTEKVGARRSTGRSLLLNTPNPWMDMCKFKCKSPGFGTPRRGTRTGWTRPGGSP